MNISGNDNLVPTFSSIFLKKFWIFQMNVQRRDIFQTESNLIQVLNGIV